MNLIHLFVFDNTEYKIYCHDNAIPVITVKLIILLGKHKQSCTYTSLLFLINGSTLKEQYMYYGYENFKTRKT